MNCTICRIAPATLFLVVRQPRKPPVTGLIVAKAHTCLECHTILQEALPQHPGMTIEEVSQSEYNDTPEDHDAMGRPT